MVNETRRLAIRMPLTGIRILGFRIADGIVIGIVTYTGKSPTLEGLNISVSIFFFANAAAFGFN